MPYSKDNIPAVAKTWDEDEQHKCIVAANAVLEESDDEEQAIFACIHAAGKSKEMIAKFSEHHKLDAEIFAVGKWNGMLFGRADLDAIADNFLALQTLHKVPLKFGHNDGQPITDGQPALGWVTKVWRSGDKLFAQFEHVPQVVRKAFEARLYRRVSIELDIGVEHKGKKYSYVLSGVALLGADIPAVNTLADLNHYLDSGQRLAASRRAAFSAVYGDINNEDSEMNDDFMKKIEALTEQLAVLAAAQAEVVKENATLGAENVTLKAKIDATEKGAMAEKVKMHRSALVGRLENAVKANKLLPAQREMAIKFMRIDDDAAALTVTPGQIDEFISMNGKSAQFSQSGSADSGNRDEGDDVGEVLVDRVRELRQKNTGLSFAQARDKVLAADPELGKKWLN